MVSTCGGGRHHGLFVRSIQRQEKASNNLVHPDTFRVLIHRRLCTPQSESAKQATAIRVLVGVALNQNLLIVLIADEIR